MALLSSSCTCGSRSVCLGGCPVLFTVIPLEYMSTDAAACFLKLSSMHILSCILSPALLAFLFSGSICLFSAFAICIEFRSSNHRGRNRIVWPWLAVQTPDSLSVWSQIRYPELWKLQINSWAASVGPRNEAPVSHLALSKHSLCSLWSLRVCFVNSLHLSEKVWGKRLQTTQWELGQIPGLSFTINVQIRTVWVGLLHTVQKCLCESADLR